MKVLTYDKPLELDHGGSDYLLLGDVENPDHGGAVEVDQGGG